MRPIRTVCVYCGSSTGRDPVHAEAARALGERLAAEGLALVYGGGARGLMGVVASAVRAGGGRVTGVIPDFLVAKEGVADLDEHIVVPDMHRRKQIMFERADAFVALPGGIGTLEELVEMMTWVQLGRHDKPVIVANIAGFWDPLRLLLDHMAGQGFLSPAFVGAVAVARSAAEVGDMLASHRVRPTPQGALPLDRL